MKSHEQQGMPLTRVVVWNSWDAWDDFIDVRVLIIINCMPHIMNRNRPTQNKSQSYLKKKSFSVPLPCFMKVALTTCVAPVTSEIILSLRWSRTHLKVDGRVSWHWFGSNLRFPSFSNQCFLSYQSEFSLWSIFTFLLYPCCVHCFTEKEKANEFLSNFSPLFPVSFQQGNFTSTVQKPLT